MTKSYMDKKLVFSFIKNIPNVNLNNGEKLESAVGKWVKELVILLLSLVIMIAIAVGFNTALDLYTDDDYENMYFDGGYKNIYSMNINVIENDLTTYSMLNTLSNWNSGTQNLHENEEFITLNNLVPTIETMLPEYEIQYYSNMKNSEFLDKIYENLDEKLPVVVAIANEDTGLMEYAFISYMSPHDNLIKYVTSDGVEHNATFDNFISMTRFNNLDEQEFYFRMADYSGFYNPNTAVFVTLPSYDD